MREKSALPIPRAHDPSRPVSELRIFSRESLPAPNERPLADRQTNGTKPCFSI
jgi:hypothetical protein